MESNDQLPGKRFLFTLDLLIEGESSAEALEKLRRIMTSGDVADFRIQSGMEIGGLVEQALGNAANKEIAVTNKALKSPGNPPKSSKKSEAPRSGADEATQRIRGFMEDGRLIRLNVNKGRGVKLSVPCRILSFDDSKMMITVYHVDEKQVYTFMLNEIDDFV